MGTDATEKYKAENGAVGGWGSVGVEGSGNI